MKEIRIDISHKIGEIKPLHGICNGPLSMAGWRDMSKEYKALGVPFVRLHDTDYPHPQTVDVYQIFRRFDADENDEKNYDFLLTDQYLSAIHAVGADIIYRLGTSIEHVQTPRYTDPPKDKEKFARVCEHIIRHYNEGWANGFRFGIRYWEIWNEPEGVTGQVNKKMWNGTEEEYFALYETVSKHLRAVFGESIRIGAYASCGFYALGHPGMPEENFISFLQHFLAYVKACGAPLDFLPYHYYGNDASVAAQYAYYAEKLLSDAGFQGVFLILDEWNTGFGSEEEFERLNGIFGACHAVDMFCSLADSPVMIATYYDGQPHMPWCGLFDRMGRVQKPYFAFDAYSKLYALKNRVQVLGKNEKILAASDGRRVRVLITGEYLSEKEEELSIRFDGIAPQTVQVSVMNGEHGFVTEERALEDGALRISLPAKTVVFIEG